MMPVLSKTPFAPICASYSMYSADVGVAASARATRIDAIELPLLQILTDTRLKYPKGTEYNVVSVAADNAACPNNPVAIIDSTLIIQ